MDYRVKYTALGLAKIAAAELVGGNIDLTHIAVGDAGGAYYELADTPVMTDLVNEVWRGAIDLLYIDPADPTQIVMEAPLPPGNGPFMLREGGAFDSAGDLLLVWLMPLSDVPALIEGSPKDMRFRIFRKVTNAALFTLILDANVATASRAYVDDSGSGWKSAHIRNVIASCAVLATDKILSIDASAGDVTVTVFAADNAAARKLSFHREDDTANMINLLVVAGTVCRMDSYPGFLTGQDEVRTIIPKASTNNWIEV